MLLVARAGVHRSVWQQTWRQMQKSGLNGFASPRMLLRSYYETGTAEEGSISYLRNEKNGAQVFLVGTAHVSAESAEEVRQVSDLIFL